MSYRGHRLALRHREIFLGGQEGLLETGNILVKTFYFCINLT